ncbi:hypothetical protein RJ640_006198 [Escallonia rubra]|uniref:Cathepsin propeptide inhibitor domain-containing protein n=1 Tax=Escallonia rubra TaxID=112253 RepID=A0AA88QWW5_9ASTE|nr:hypothetical protein RJ640_006198 [Escallonia rubra]
MSNQMWIPRIYHPPVVFMRKAALSPHAPVERSANTPLALLPPMAALLLFFLFVSASASDMSIIKFDETRDTKSSWRPDDEVMAVYESWLVEHGKSYNRLGEKEKRFQIFKDNFHFIDEQNAANRSFKLGLNRFADLTNEEYRSMYLGTKIDSKKRLAKGRKSDRYAPRASDSLPESVDWRAKGAVAPVKDQGSCGELLLPFSSRRSYHGQHVCGFDV